MYYTRVADCLEPCPMTSRRRTVTPGLRERADARIRPPFVAIKFVFLTTKQDHRRGGCFLIDRRTARILRNMAPLLIVLTLGTSAQAGEAGTSQPVGLQPLDWFLIGVYALLANLAVGTFVCWILTPRRPRGRVPESAT